VKMATQTCLAKESTMMKDWDKLKETKGHDHAIKKGFRTFIIAYN